MLTYAEDVLSLASFYAAIGQHRFAEWLIADAARLVLCYESRATA